MADTTTRDRKRTRRLSGWLEKDPPSLTRPRVTFCPPPAPDLPDIPHSPVGLIDTVKIVIQHPCSSKDRRVLLGRTDFKIVQCSGSTVVDRGVPIREFGRRTELHRDTDGLRIRITDSRIEIEVSLPRVLGLRNDDQYRMTEEDVLFAVSTVTTELFPVTTLRARFPKHGQERRYWYITRIDIAVTFSGSVQEYVETYRRSSRPRSSSKPTCYSETGLAFFGKDYELVIYDPSQRQPQGRLRQLLRGRRFRRVPNRVRVELRFKTPRAIKQLLRHFGLDQRGLPFFDGNSDGGEAVYRFGLDHHRLHQVLAQELSYLGSSVRTTASSSRAMNLVRNFGFRYLAQNGSAWAEVQDAYSARQYRRLKQEFTAFQAQTKRIDIVRAAWRRPRHHPSIKHQRLRSLRGRLLAWSLSPPVLPESELPSHTSQYNPTCLKASD